VEEIIETGKKLFFKGGHSYFGDLETMSVCPKRANGHSVYRFKWGAMHLHSFVVLINLFHNVLKNIRNCIVIFVLSLLQKL
jgi:hypothetical protein